MDPRAEMSLGVGWNSFFWYGCFGQHCTQMAPHKADSDLESLGLYWHFGADLFSLRCTGINFTPQKDGIADLSSTMLKQLASLSILWLINFHFFFLWHKTWRAGNQVRSRSHCLPRRVVLHQVGTQIWIGTVTEQRTWKWLSCQRIDLGTNAFLMRMAWYHLNEIALNLNLKS